MDTALLLIMVHSVQVFHQWKSSGESIPGARGEESTYGVNLSKVITKWSSQLKFPALLFRVLEGNLFHPGPTGVLQCSRPLPHWRLTVLQTPAPLGTYSAPDPWHTGKQRCCCYYAVPVVPDFYDFYLASMKAKNLEICSATVIKNSPWL